MAKIYQDAAGWHVVVPPKLGDTPLTDEEKDSLIEVSLQWKNPDFLLRNPDFLLKNLDFSF